MSATHGKGAPSGGGHLGANRFDVKMSSHGAGWMVSYADLMTIILTFMILLLSISTIAQTKYDLLVTALTGKKTGNLQEVKEKIDQVITEQTLEGEVTTDLDDDGLKIEFSNALLFESGQADLRPRALEVFAPIEAHLVQDLEPHYGLIIEGYTDDVPISSGRYRSNWELSTSRAIHVMERLVTAGLDRRRLSVQGFADTRAATDVDLLDADSVRELTPQQLEEVRAANRRVIIRIDALDPDIVQKLGRSVTHQIQGSSPAPTDAPTDAPTVETDKEDGL